MVTLTSVLVATAVVMVLAVVVGVWIGRSKAADRVRQTLPRRWADDAAIRLPGADPDPVRV